MSIVVRFTPRGMTAEQYDRVSSQLRESGDWPPDGLDYHVCFGSEGNLVVSEIWDSQEQLEAFGQKLMPVLEEGGIQMASEPEIFEVHTIEKR
jgi:hypothetical protein